MLAPGRAERHVEFPDRISVGRSWRLRLARIGEHAKHSLAHAGLDRGGRPPDHTGPEAPPRSTTLAMAGATPRYSATVAGTCCGVSPT